MHRKFWRVAVALALLVIAVLPAQAQNWPTRVVKFIVPFGPGAQIARYATERFLAATLR